LWSKLNSWKGLSISVARREVLIKAIAHAVPNFTSVYLFRHSLGGELQKMMNFFWWGAKSRGHKGIQWLSCDNLSISKDEGGVGFRNM